MTLSVVDKDKHFTLAVIPWTKEMKNLDGIQQCIDIIHNFGLKIKCLCLDRQFYAANILRYLQNQRIPHIVPAKVNCDELRNKLKERKSKTFQYVINSGKKNALEITICDCVLYLMGKKEKHGTAHHPLWFTASPLLRERSGKYTLIDSVLNLLTGCVISPKQRPPARIRQSGSFIH